MKFLRTIVFLTAIFVSCLDNFSQERPALIEEFGKECSEQIMARYDNFLNALNNQPNAMGYFVFYGDKSVEGRNLNFIKYLTEYYPRTRGFDNSRFILLRGENQDEMKVQFWLVPARATPPKPEKEFIKSEITSTTLFDKNWADFNNWYFNNPYGELRIYSDGFLALGCEFSPNVGAFAKILLSNPKLTGYLIVYTKFGKGVKRGDQVGNFALNDLIKYHKVPRNRLKAIYGGNRKEPEIELWLVPKGDMPPKPTPDKKP
jgi:hypothetical protein